MNGRAWIWKRLTQNSHWQFQLKLHFCLSYFEHFSFSIWAAENLFIAEDRWLWICRINTVQNQHFFFTNANHKSNVKENTNDNPAFVCIKMYQFNVSFGHFFSLTLLLYIHFKTSKPFFFFSVKRWSIFLLSVCSVLTMHVYWNRMQFTPWNIETSFHLRSFLIRVTTPAPHLYSLSRIMIGFVVVVVGQILLTN